MKRKQRRRRTRNLGYINHSLNNILLNQAYMYTVLERIEKNTSGEVPRKLTK
ncbi:hypothetical protein [Clostridium sp. D33t1_170424_F3]|uniref:hypothetical protein n=1 Tax=Clostridium sp. D33t1_170424_F3 TaxID=2787099 RepID=UPI0018A8BAF5|nr:hypothetical protein [Clostridium sp. D33t1_170424_F3]